MDIEIIHPNYRCKENTIIEIALQAWENFSIYQNSFYTFSAYYNETKYLEQIEFINSVKNLYFSKLAISNKESENLKNQNKLVCQKWQFLKRYIQGAYPKKYHASKLKNAGKEFYFTAYRFNFNDTLHLIQQSSNFITNYRIILQLDQNMPEYFFKEYIDTCSKFEELNIQYQQSKDEKKINKYDKIKALNKIYKSLSEMLYDAKAIFANDKELLKLFSFKNL